ncbi:extracellular solute-binding protein [Paenibacillus radicis (ex Xue et al. 2023)]|uniref:Extracellular solute-binding protein n=1 Tax=Paenibacillus radicis (ex Xue et al. 2023) TaxID=2972489 RepID=A0ABT1YGD2_9BACL|nr:extracellular solute-binding protein [Paenibacillus radicis (ex Xue et al. 2023)]MCR8632257.1 extracellular solute-binding protein [Paenibacillus radicis (ex Xue et al. 2023)]
MKRASVLLLATTMLSVTVLNGCTKQEEKAASTPSEPESVVSQPGVLPITKEKTTLKVLVTGRPNIDFPTSSATKWVEDQTNVHVEWQVAPEGAEAQAKLNVVLASGDYPDVIMNFGVSNTQQLSNGKQGIFIPLNKLIEKYGVEIKKVFTKFRTVKEDITSSDGNIYSLPRVAECYQCSMGQKLWLYKPWLDKLNLKVPTTPEELYLVLKAFKEKDPNGNGKADEIPLSGSIGGDHTTIDEFLMNAFVLNSVSGTGGGFSITDGQHMYVNNGKIEASFVQPGWKEGLKYLNKLYTEKLLDQQSLTQNLKQLKALGENPKEVILGATSALGIGTFTQYGGPSGRWKDYVAVAPLKGPSGVQITPYNPNSTFTGEFIVTKAAKHPDVAVRWADFMYNDDVTWKLQKGEEGLNWRKPQPGEIGANGKPAVFTQLAPIAEEKSNNNWYQRGLFATDDAQRYTSTVDPKAPKPQAVILYEATKNQYEPYQQKADTIIPTLFMDVDQSKQVVDYSNSIGAYVGESMARFVTGDLNIDKDWDAYIKQLNTLNLPKLLAIYQTAYEAKKKK